MRLQDLDAQHRLTPWLYPDHQAYVIGAYAGMLVNDPKAASKYLATYKRKEDEDRASYDLQKENIEKMQRNMGVEVSEFPAREYLKWDPEKAIKMSSLERRATEKAQEKELEDRKVANEKAEKEREARAKKAEGEAVKEAKKEEKEAKEVAKDVLSEEEFVALDANEQRLALKKAGVAASEDSSNEEKRLALYLEATKLV